MDRAITFEGHIYSITLKALSNLDCKEQNIFITVKTQETFFIIQLVYD